MLTFVLTNSTLGASRMTLDTILQVIILLQGFVLAILGLIWWSILRFPDNETIKSRPIIRKLVYSLSAWVYLIFVRPISPLTDRKRQIKLSDGRSVAMSVDEIIGRYDQYNGVTRIGRIAAFSSNRRALQRIARCYYEEHNDHVCFSKHTLNYNGESPDLIIDEKWIPMQPIPTNDIILDWRQDVADPEPLQHNLHSQLQDKLSRRMSKDLAYRLLEVNRAGELVCGPTDYLQYIDTCEALAWEVAETALDYFVRPSEILVDTHVLHQRIGRAASSLRRRIGLDPFNFYNRAAVIGVNTLTILVSRKSDVVRVLLHDRSKATAGLAEAIDTLHVVPAGTFQPIACPPNVRTLSFSDCEFSITRNIMRECGEELLDRDEVIKEWGNNDPDAPFRKDPDLRHLKSLFDSERIKPFYLGMALDMLTLKPELLTFQLIDYEDLLSGLTDQALRQNWEGALARGIENRRGVGRSEPLAGLFEVLKEPSLLPAAGGIVCLMLRNKAFVEDAIREFSA